jgi:F420-non-reducing hydrogenase small subunit
MSKLKLAAYWAAACGGCDVSILDLHEKILDVAEIFDIPFWPIAVDGKYSDVEAMEDNEIFLCLFNGGIRNAEGLHIAQLLRQKSQIFVAYGSCACFGGVPGLANQACKDEVFDRAYVKSPSTDNEGKFPTPKSEHNGNPVELPEFFDGVLPLSACVDVDFVMPGCPPNPDRLWDVVGLVKAVLAGEAELPPKGATIGAGHHSLCEACDRTKTEGLEIERFYRPFEKVPDKDVCLMEQGFVCLGPVTREGCGHRCIDAQIPCRGCYGPLEGVVDQGARFAAAVATQMTATDPDKIDAVLETIPDPLGTFYRYSLPSGTIWRAKK